MLMHTSFKLIETVVQDDLVYGGECITVYLDLLWVGR